LKTYHGSCHCRGVKFTAKLDLSKGIGRCNCTFCYKTGIRLTFVKQSDFKLLSGKSLLQNYPPAKEKRDKNMFFCKRCGVRCFTQCLFDMEPFEAGFYAVNINSLDDLKPSEIIKAPRHYGDGLHDNWGEAPKEIRHIW
jgi:hypothetical protein